MKLSVTMPSHNVGTRINANILNACSMGGGDVEVVIRDNSGNEEKRNFLSQIKEENCRILIVDECSGAENATCLMDAAEGQFAFFVADDDFTNAFSIPSILEEIDRIKDDKTIIGTTGVSIVDEALKTHIADFAHLNAPTPLERFTPFLNIGWPSVFQFAPLRLGVQRDVWSFASRLPVYLSYHDLLMNCMFLMHGRVTSLKRFFYQYYNLNWKDEAAHLVSDAQFFQRAGLDTSGVRLLWLIAAFEGMQTFASKYQRVQVSDNERQALGVFWFRHWFSRFLEASLVRQSHDAKFDAQALTLAKKWRVNGAINLSELLTDITEYYALSSPEVAQRYYDFWK